MYKNICLVALAAVIAALVTLLPPLAPGVAAETPAAAQPQSAATLRCALQGWPYYDASCLRGSSGEVRPARIIALDRVQASR